MAADEAAEFIDHGNRVGMSGFTGAAYPKAVPQAIARRATEAHDRGDEFQIDLFTGASTGPECDGELAAANAVRYRSPYQSDPTMRAYVNSGQMMYGDMHLSHSGLWVEQGFLGHFDVAVIQVTRITEDGRLVPSSGVGNNLEFIEAVDRVILEVNHWMSEDLEGMADIWRMPPLPDRVPVPITAPGDRIGTPYIDIDVSKVVAVVETDAPDRNAPFKPVDEISTQIAGRFLDFLEGEVAAGRLAYDRYVMQSGVGNMPNAVMAGLLDSKFENITSYTEVIQDGMLDLIDAGKMTVASATSFSLSPEYAEKMNRDAARYRNHIVTRPLQISNSPEVIRRLGVIASNGFLSTFISPSVAKNGAVSAIGPFASHIDHHEHDVMVVITEHGYADLRGLAPRERVKKMIAIAAPEYRPLLEEYVDAASCDGSQHTPHDLHRAFSFHTRLLDTGTMLG